ncbi:glycosyltransferase family 2 protein [Microseira wollei]|uniref:Glycosyl transferase family 2 n=1 Tax=Microseira wollei NIES-4236 TaxID=2530354 RepID=A0AAV3X396_9CYAN|nr:glycosyltransferase family 2 protein [Microseira wollei]GET35676.1 glycosyl transferase family 2 [Microseira wollei NIES-4236]
MNKPLVSCIIIFFNAEKFFEEAIESVFAQTYDNWELLLADDGSSDRSTAIAQAYAQKYPDKVLYLEHENHQNRGMSATRNLGIRNAKGQYIAFLDADDVWLPSKLDQQVEIMESQPDVAMVYGRSQYWLSWTGHPDDIQKDYIPDAYLPAQIYHPPTLLTQCYPLGHATPPPPSDIILRRETIERLGGFEAGFQGIYQLYEDQAFFAKLYLQYPVFVSGECWDKYRLHPDSCGSVVNKSGKYQIVRQFFLNWLENYLSAHKIQDAQVWKALKNALLAYRNPTLFKLKKLTERWLGRIGGLVKSLTTKY